MEKIPGNSPELTPVGDYSEGQKQEMEEASGFGQQDAEQSYRIPENEHTEVGGVESGVDPKVDEATDAWIKDAEEKKKQAMGGVPMNVPMPGGETAPGESQTA